MSNPNCIKRHALVIACAAAVFAGFGTQAHGAPVTLTVSDGGGETSFDTGLNWSDGLAPSAGKEYQVANTRTLRTRDLAGDQTFLGDKLALGDGSATGQLTIKGGEASRSTVITVNNLVLDKGTVAIGSAKAFTLAGNILVAAGGGTLSNTGTDRSLTVTAPISGTGALKLQGTAGRLTGFDIDVRGVNTFAGTTMVDGGVVILDDLGSMLMDVNSTGASSAIVGSNNPVLTVDGTFVLDVAGVTGAGSWNLVDAATLIETYGTSFDMKFSDNTVLTQSADVWTGTKNGFTFTYTESTGVLAAVVPEPASLGVLGAGAIGLLRRRRKA